MEEKTLDIIEIFGSVQGETTFAGLPTTFVRLARCNQRCSWCDTTYSFGRGEPVLLEMIIANVEKRNLPYVCITGGEPLLQKNVYPLMEELCNRDYKLSIETGGALPIDKIDPRVHTILDIKCPGSLMSRKNHWPNLGLLRPQDEVKFVLLDEDDYHYAVEICKKYGLFKRESYPLFSPVHGELDPKMLTNWIIRDQLPVRVNIQIHKYIWCPDTQGV